jgi:hypothetical protein
MLKVNGSSIAVPVSPPMPGMMPSTRPMMQPSPRNIRRWGSIKVRNAWPAEAAMKPSSPPIMSIRFGLLETPARVGPRRVPFAPARSTLPIAVPGQINPFAMKACTPPDRVAPDCRPSRIRLPSLKLRRSNKPAIVGERRCPRRPASTPARRPDYFAPCKQNIPGRESRLLRLGVRYGRGWSYRAAPT